MGYFLYAIFCFAGGMGASPLTALIRGQFVRGSHKRRRPFFADNFSDAEIIFLAKSGQAKIA